MSIFATEVERDVTLDAPSMRIALGAALMVIALPGTIFFSWSVVSEVSAGFITAGVVFALLTLLPVLAAAIATRRQRSVTRGLTAALLAGGVQLLCTAVLLFFVPTI